MGSSFSVINDTKQTVWIKHGVCKPAIIGSVAGVATILTAGAAGVAVGIFGAAAVAGVLVDAAAVFSGINAVTVTNLLAIGVLGGMKLTKEQNEALNKVKEKLKSYEQIKPGEKYRVAGSCSLVLTVYAVTDDFKEVSKDCFTGSTIDSNRIYKLSEHFNLR